MLSGVRGVVVACGLLVLLMVVVVSGARRRGRGPACFSAPHERHDCGWGGITAYECVQRGCCWQECHGLVQA